MEFTSDSSSPVYARLDRYSPSLNRGRSAWVELCWIVVQGCAFSTWLPGSTWRVVLLRLFGATIGEGVVIKPGVRVKFPWKLTIGNYSWIGENAWIDNLAEVRIGDHCCVSQQVYLCTGSHKWNSVNFPLVVRDIVLCDGCWVAARATIAPGVVVGPGSVLGLGAVATSDLVEGWVYLGIPAKPIKQRYDNGL